MMETEPDLNLLPIAVGFDLRLHDIAVSVPTDCTSAAYVDPRNEERVVRGSTTEVVATLRAAGYRCTVAAQ